MLRAKAFGSGPVASASRARTVVVRAAVAAAPVQVPIKFVDGVSAGSEELSLGVAPANTAKGLVHRYLVYVQQNARRVSAVIACRALRSAMVSLRPCAMPATRGCWRTDGHVQALEGNLILRVDSWLRGRVNPKRPARRRGGSGGRHSTHPTANQPGALTRLARRARPAPSPGVRCAAVARSPTSRRARAMPGAAATRPPSSLAVA